MAKATYSFPRGFLWGTATASQQAEGQNINNNWSAWETQPGRIREGHKAGLACDWWGGRWKEDFDRAKETGQNAHRLSIEWSRIQPTPDRWDEDALDHYRQMVRGLVDRGMTPMVTLHHFSDPLWLVDRGGWESPETPALFEAYTRKVVQALKSYVSLWCTINEPNVYTVCSYLTGEFPPGKTDLNATSQVYINLVKGHVLSYKAIHEIQPAAQVSIAMNYNGFEPSRPWFFLDTFLSNFMTSNFNYAFPMALKTGKLNFAAKRTSIPEAAGTMDYYGLNYYTVQKVAFVLKPKDMFFRRFFPEGSELSPTGFIANRPDGFFKAMQFANSFDLPIYITENGVEDPEDTFRPKYTVQHIHQMWRAVNYTYPIRGYFHWTLVDNFEWERGWTQRFGLWGLNLDTQERIRRKSVDVYARICKENAISSDMVAEYIPGLLPVLFPD